MTVCYNASRHFYYPHLQQQMANGSAVLYIKYHLQFPECRFEAVANKQDYYCYTVVYSDLTCGIKASQSKVRTLYSILFL